MNTKEKLICILALLAFLVAIIYGMNRIMGWVVLQFSHKYTIGFTIDATEQRGTPVISYKFKVGGKDYSGVTIGSTKRENWKNAPFIVKYVPGFPNWSRMHFNRDAVDTSLISIPADGWDEIPDVLKTE